MHESVARGLAHQLRDAEADRDRAVEAVRQLRTALLASYGCPNPNMMCDACKARFQAALAATAEWETP